MEKALLLLPLILSLCMGQDFIPEIRGVQCAEAPTDEDDCQDETSASGQILSEAIERQQILDSLQNPFLPFPVGGIPINPFPFPFPLGSGRAAAQLGRKRFPPISGRIIGGNFATGGQFPYIAALYMTDRCGTTIDENIFFFCAGTVVHQRFIVTAAHCLDAQRVVGRRGVNNLIVKVGANSRAFTGAGTTEGGRFIFANAVVIHPNWDRDTLRNDIAIIRLCEDVGVEEASLLPATDSAVGILSLPEGADLQVAGWGQTINEDPNSVSVALRQTTVQLESFDFCNSQVFQGRMERATQFCAGVRAGGSSTCTGDSGGPYIIPGTRSLFGIVSYGRRNTCGLPNAPRVATYAPSYTQWIMDTIDSF